MSTESEYLSKLDSNAKQRYLEKISFIDHVDPYVLKDNDFSDNIDSYPNVTYPDIVNYFLFAPSPLTKDQLKAYKALDSYNQFVSGWVINVGVKLFGKHALIHGKVKHSQKMNDVPLHPWIISEKSGSIVCAHCDCMAGLGESCSHVGAVLFHIECAVKIKSSKTCTEEKAYWLLPSSKKIEFKPVADIDFTSPKSLQRNLNNKIHGIIYDKKISHRKSVSIPTKEETDKFFLDLSQCGTKPAILSIIPGFTKPYEPSIITEKYPESLSDLYHKKTFLNFEQLLAACKQKIITITIEQSKNVESSTRLQAKNKNWFYFRAGRITASKFGSVCCASITQPPISLIMQICYPIQARFCTAATKWGNDHEKKALILYSTTMEKKHSKFSIKNCGFFISVQQPFLGASPDSVIYCDCCGNGCLEIKCPYIARDKYISELLSSKNSCLENKGGFIALKKSHKYYYQIQCQLYASLSNYCDFFIWTLKDSYCERILPDLEFMDKNITKCKQFFEECILPELINKFYSQRNQFVKEMSEKNNFIQIEHNYFQKESIVFNDHDYCLK